MVAKRLGANSEAKARGRKGGAHWDFKAVATTAANKGTVPSGVLRVKAEAAAR